MGHRSAILTVMKNILCHQTLRGGPGRGAMAVLSAVLVGACTTFSPSPPYQPPYYIDEYGMVYETEYSQRGNDYRLRPQYGSFGLGVRVGSTFYDPFYDPAYDSVFGLYGNNLFYRHPFYARSPYLPPVVPPSYRPTPGSGNPGQPPTGVVTPVTPQPSASPVITQPLVRVHPEPRLRFRQHGDARRAWRGAGADNSAGRRGAYGAAGNRAPRPMTRTTPRPRPTPPPNRPREIDP